MQLNERICFLSFVKEHLKSEHEASYCFLQYDPTVKDSMEAP